MKCQRQFSENKKKQKKKTKKKKKKKLLLKFCPSCSALIFHVHDNAVDFKGVDIIMVNRIYPKYSDTLRGLDMSGRFSTICNKGVTFMTICLLAYTLNSFWKVHSKWKFSPKVHSKRKEFATEHFFFSFRADTYFQKGAKINPLRKQTWKFYPQKMNIFR